jgi:integrase
MKLKLTDVTIRNLPIPEKGQKSYYDLTFPTLAVRVSQGGTKTFVLEGGKRGARTLKTLGRYPALTLAEARSKARILQISPDEPAAITFGEAVASYLALATNHMSRSSVSELTRILTKVFQPLHSVPITGVTSKHMSDIIDAMPANALYTHGRVKTFMRWCRMRSLIQINPIEFLPAPSRYIPRDRILTDNELRRIWHAASELGNYGCVVRLLICTGARRSEMANMRPEWIRQDLLIIPKEHTKSKQEHVVPICEFVRGLIPEAGEISFVFPAMDRDAPISGWSKYKKRLDKLSGVTGATHHDIRRTFRTNLIRWKCCTPDIAERLIGHKTGSEVSRIYDRYDRLPEKREAMERYTERLRQVIELPIA